MSSPQTPSTGALRRRPVTALSAGLAAVLLASACSSGGAASDASSSAPASSAAASTAASSSASPAAPAKRKAVGEGQGDPAALAGVHVAVGDDRTPQVKLDGPVKADKPSTRVLTAGEGELPTNGDTVRVSTVAIDPTTGQVIGENFSTSPQSAPLSDQVKALYPEMYELLTTNGVGSIVAAYSPEQQVQVPAPAPSSGSTATPSPSSSTAPAALYAYRIDGIMPKAASGTEVKERDARLPEVTVDGAGKPQIAKPQGSAPGELVVEPLIQGDGPVVGEDDAVTVQYTGVKWSDGSVFDSSWDRGQPASFSLDQVIPGWKEGLKGQKVGSRVLVSIPADKAYGSAGSPPKIGPDEALLFVVDLLDAQSPQAEPTASPSPSGSSSATPSASASPRG